MSTSFSLPIVTKLDELRLQELRPLAPMDCEIVIYQSEEYVDPGNLCLRLGLI